MIVQYQYVTWNPPYLTDEEELELGRQIALQGREHFVTEFRKSIGRPKGQPETPPASPLKMFFAILFFIVGIGVIAALGLFPLFAVLAVMVTGIYLVSLHFATRNFGKWIDRLVSKYAAHVARGDK